MYYIQIKIELLILLIHLNCIITKGQIISEQICGVLNFPKMQRNYCKDFCPSLYHGSNQKKTKALYYIKWYIITNLHDNVPLFFLFGSF